MLRRGFVAGLLASGGIQCTPRSLFRGRSPHLARVKASPERIVRTLTGLRPFRPSGFVVRVETIGGKTLVHDYGHGGAGVTLSWGTAQQAIDLVARERFTSAAVLGAGAVGLATATLLQRRGFSVTIYAANVPPDTTSNRAGAMWSPFLVADHDKRTPEFDDRMHAAARLAHRAFSERVGSHFGVRWIDSFQLLDEPPSGGPSPLADLFPGRRLLGAGAHPFPTKYAETWKALFIDPRVYLDALVTDLRAGGARLIVGEIADRDAIAKLDAPVVFNCTGLGSRALFGDSDLIPIKGQLTVLAPQPEVDYLMEKDDLYMFPRADGILLGGTHERGESSLEPNEEAAKTVMAGHRAIFEAMRG